MANKKLRVWYGWFKLNKIYKKEGISVIFENEFHLDNEKKVSRWQNTVYCRYQIPAEMEGVENFKRIFDAWDIFLNQKDIKGSLELALLHNFIADKSNVPEKEREAIRDKLRKSFLSSHLGYVEPNPTEWVEYQKKLLLGKEVKYVEGELF